jgi:hypothetical protein
VRQKTPCGRCVDDDSDTFTQAPKRFGAGADGAPTGLASDSDDSSSVHILDPRAAIRTDRS